VLDILNTDGLGRVLILTAAAGDFSRQAGAFLQRSPASAGWAFSGPFGGLETTIGAKKQRWHTHSLQIALFAAAPIWQVFF